jgi:DNA-binding GntR family transcriptional regulator
MRRGAMTKGRLVAKETNVADVELVAESTAAPIETAYRVVMDAVKEGISTGRFAPGQRLIEGDLSSKLGVGRSSVREGLRLLAAEGLVQLEHNRGVRVRQYDRDDILSINQIRQALEGLGASLAAGNTDKRDFKSRFGVLLEKEEKAVEDKRLDQWFACNRAFHSLIMEMSGNTHLHEHLTKLPFSYLIRTSLWLQSPPDFKYLATRHAEHERIVQAIMRGDRQKAELAMRTHLHNSVAELRWPD